MTFVRFIPKEKVKNFVVTINERGVLYFTKPVADWLITMDYKFIDLYYDRGATAIGLKFSTFSDGHSIPIHKRLAGMSSSIKSLLYYYNEYPSKLRAYDLLAESEMYVIYLGCPVDPPKRGR